MKEAAHSIATRVACLKETPNVLVICGNHNIAFASSLIKECYAERANPHLWAWNENSLKNEKGIVAEGVVDKLAEHTLSLLKNSDLVIWLTQFENPLNAKRDLGIAVCSFWDEVYQAIQDKPRLLVNLFSQESMRALNLSYEKYLTAFTSGVTVDYEKMKETGSTIKTSLKDRILINVTDPNGTDLSFNIENRRAIVETGILRDCILTGEECEIEIPAGEVYVAPLENSAFGRLVVDEVKDFGVRHLEMAFEAGKISGLTAGKGEARFREFLENAEGGRDILAEFGIGINQGVKPIGLRIQDEKAFGTVHVAIGNNANLGGVNKASIHLDFNLYRPTIRADADLIMKEGHIMSNRSTPQSTS